MIDSKQIIEEISNQIINALFEGGEGSGNWGHAGIPGVQGGSQPTKGGTIFKQGIRQLGWHTGGERGSITSSLFKAARLSATARALFSGSPKKMGRRAANILIGRKAVSHVYLRGNPKSKKSWWG